MPEPLGAQGSSPIDSRLDELYAAERRPLRFGEAWRLLVKSWPFIRAHRRLLWLKCVLAVSSLVLFLLTPWPIKIIIDNVLDGRPLTGVPARILLPMAGHNRALLLAAVTAFLLVATLLAGIFGDQPTGLDTAVESQGLDQTGMAANDANSGWSLWNGLLGWWETSVTLRLTHRINQDLRTKIYERFLRSPLALYGDQRIGDAVFRVMNDSAAIGAVFYRGVLTPVMAAVMFILTLVVLTAEFPNEPLIPLLAAFALPIIAVGSGVFGRLLRGQIQVMRERGSEVMAAFEERLAHVELIKAYVTGERERRTVDAASWESFRATLKMFVIVMLVVTALAPAVGFLVMTGLYHLMREVIARRITLGDLVLLGGYGLLLGRPAEMIGATWFALQGPISGLRRIHSVLDRLGESDSLSSADSDPGRITQLEFREATFAYGDGPPVVSRVSFTLRAGELAALAGANGVGKTTVISAIPRFIEPTAGALLINGIDARRLGLSALRRRVGFVFQQEALFSRSIADNIRYGAPDASDAMISEAARMAGAAEFIEQLPHGYATMLGRRGARLSVGQKQRIAIARALIRERDALVLDEPTAPLDAASEADLIRTLRELARRRIVLLVAHRPSTLAACDRVFFLDGGRVAACGPHDELVKESDAYRAYLALADSPTPA